MRALGGATDLVKETFMIDKVLVKRFAVIAIVAAVAMMACSKGSFSGSVTRGERARHLVKAKASFRSTLQAKKKRCRRPAKRMMRRSGRAKCRATANMSLSSGRLEG